MKRCTFYIVDVFAEEKYAGNQLAVVRGAKALPDIEMQQIAKEINFSEQAVPKSQTLDSATLCPGHLGDAHAFLFMSIHWILNYHLGADLLNKGIFRLRENCHTFYIDSNINYKVGLIDGCIQSETSKKSTGLIDHRWIRKVLMVN